MPKVRAASRNLSFRSRAESMVTGASIASVSVFPPSGGACRACPPLTNTALSPVRLVETEPAPPLWTVLRSRPRWSTE